jgi:hypothetical protein
MASRCRALVVALVFLAAGSARAAQAAEADPSFDDFLAKFTSDPHFRLDRIQYPLSVRVGNPAVVEVRVEKWQQDQVRKELPPLLLAAELKEQGLDQRVKRASGTRVVVVQFKPEAQSTLRNYTFERLKGRWFLIRFEDASR